MVVLGIDVHKHTHTTVAVDQVGRQLGQRTVRTNDQGCTQLLSWARTTWPGDQNQRLWAIEDCRHVSGRLERVLLAAGERVVRVPPKLTVVHRRASRTRGKSDPIDALAVARAALADPDLPVAGHDPASRELKLLIDHRDHLIAQRTGLINRLRWHLHNLDPDFHIPARTLHRPANLARIRAFLGRQPATLETHLAAEQATDIHAITQRVSVLERDLHTRVQTLCPQLLDLPGCAHLTAAKLVAETAGVTRFATSDRYAAYAGTAPIPASSGTIQRHRLARGGNRQLNAAIHRIALTQIRIDGPGRTYYLRRQDDGKTKKEAIRALKRKITRAVYQALKTAQPDLQHSTAAAAA
jgi:transposase